MLFAYSAVGHVLIMSNMACVLREAGTFCKRLSPHPDFGVAHLFTSLCCFVFVCRRPVSCIPTVASVAGLSIRDCLLGFL